MSKNRVIEIDLEDATEEEWITVYDTLAEIEHEPDETSKAGVFFGKRVPAEGVE